MRIAIWGATGYGGAEAIRILAARTDIEVAWLGSDSRAGQELQHVLPQFRGTRVGRIPLSPTEDADLRGLDAALLAMPHGAARELAPKLLAQGLRVVDFSGDFRLPSDVYGAWYSRAAAPLAEDALAVYGLPELFREDIRSASLVANPGCYATCAALALLPLVERGLADTGRLLVDAKSGVSGAGKTPQPSTHFVEAVENLAAYKVGTHQHTPEIEQTLLAARRRRLGRLDGTGPDGVADGSSAGGGGVRVLMTTQLLPVKRGIYVTAYANLTEALDTARLHGIYAERYDSEPFVSLLPPGQAPELRHVTGTNMCRVGVYADARTGTALVMAAIDNLGKGAAGQAIHNLNLMSGCEETAGLTDLPWV